MGSIAHLQWEILVHLSNGAQKIVNGAILSQEEHESACLEKSRQMRGKYACVEMQCARSRAARFFGVHG
jgi:hypothetical protein